MIEGYARARERMARHQLKRRGIRDPVLRAMAEVPRERFLRPDAGDAILDPYADGALPIGRGQTLSQPYMVGAMTQALGVSDRDRVLEIGTGTGYNTAVLARVAAEVWTVERDPVLAEEARERLAELGFRNVRFRVGDGSLGWREGAPYAGILVTAGAPEVPKSLIEQLAPGGRLVIPVGTPDHQELLRITADDEGNGSSIETLMECRFVPLIGREGWLADRASPPGEER